MIVYNVARRFFEKKDAAESYRKELGLKPSDTLKISVDDREGLAALLNALCSAEDRKAVEAMPASVAPAALVDRAYIRPTFETVEEMLDLVPRFLLDDEGKKLWDAHHGAKR